MPATPRDLQRLQGVHPHLVTIIVSILNKLPMFVVQGVRTVAEQQALYAQGRTTPGSIVTYKDGIIHKSNHQPHADGLGHAVDMAWAVGEAFGDHQPWEAYGQLVEASGAVWGGHFRGLVDRPHAELPNT